MDGMTRLGPAGPPVQAPARTYGVYSYYGTSLRAVRTTSPGHDAIEAHYADTWRRVCDIEHRPEGTRYRWLTPYTNASTEWKRGAGERAAALIEAAS